MTTHPDNPTDKPADRLSLGFGDDFSDLSALSPAPVREAPQTRTETSVKKPKTKQARPSKSRTAKSSGKPKAEAKTKPGTDRLAKAHGFTSREAAQPVLLKKRRRVQHSEPVDQLSIRGPVRVLNSFIDYCDTHQLSYWEALEKLVEESG